MATLDNYNANIVDSVRCLVEETFKEMFDTTPELGTPDELKKAKDYVFKRGSATLLLIGADQGHYGPMKTQMKQNMVMGTNNYPKSVDETMNILNTFTKTTKMNYVKNLIIKMKEQRSLLQRLGRWRK